ncbi:hypothetical protein BC629DRAFT_1440991 [Irpex lacteus]|nr:hypothetical protein BC629DRAFT_1440991 [Irpex lacteus]
MQLNQNRIFSTVTAGTVSCAGVSRLFGYSLYCSSLRGPTVILIKIVTGCLHSCHLEVQVAVWLLGGSRILSRRLRVLEYSSFKLKIMKPSSLSNIVDMSMQEQTLVRPASRRQVTDDAAENIGVKARGFDLSVLGLPLQYFSPELPCYGQHGTDFVLLTVSWADRGQTADRSI